MWSRNVVFLYLSLQLSEIERYTSVMATAATYNPVRSAIILTLGFLLPLLASLYYDRLSAAFATSPFFSTSSATPRVYNTETQNASILSQQQSVGSLCFEKAIYIVLILIQEDASRMFHELQRTSGKWNSNHPRWRLMNSMKAYLRYGEDRTADLDTWRKRYKKLSRSQRSVCHLCIRIIVNYS